MNKYIAILSLVAGVGIFAGAITIATPRPILRTTEDVKLHAEYDAPIVSFMGSLPKNKGMAHTARTITRTTNVRTSASNSAEEDGPTFGQFSTRAAMEYHATKVHIASVPNSRVIIGKITVRHGNQ